MNKTRSFFYVLQAIVAVVGMLFPYMTDVPHFVFTDNEDMQIYCGYAIFHHDEREYFPTSILELV